MLEAAHEDALSLEKIGRAATEKLHQLYHVEPIDLEPAVYYRLTDNWLDLTMRFVTEIHGTRDVKDKISRTILSRFDTAGIGVASTIYQIVRLPPIELTTGNSQEAPNVN